MPPAKKQAEAKPAAEEQELQEATPEAPKGSEEPKAAEPKAAEPKAVEVAPEDQSDAKTDNIHGKDYEVTADRGYRVKR